MATKLPVTAAASPALDIPPSNEIVAVHIIDTLSHFDLTSASFHLPLYKGTERFKGPSYSFIIKHSSGEHVLFDMGIRKDWENLPPVNIEMFKDGGWSIYSTKNVSEILEENGVDVKDGGIGAVIWSHCHFDHIGDLTTFPTSTRLVVGRGFKDSYLPAYPENQNSAIHQHDFDGRRIEEIQYDTGLKIGRFDAHDFWGDGSFYLLDTPGHMAGHMCALARTTVNPPTYVFLGGDVSHHGGEFRPSEYLPLPNSISPSPVPRLAAPSCPGELLLRVHRSRNPTEPFYELAGKLNADIDEANWSIGGLQEFDCNEQILPIIAHDPAMMGLVDFFPLCLNGWYGKGIAQKAKWKFLDTYGEAALAYESQGDGEVR